MEGEDRKRRTYDTEQSGGSPAKKPKEGEDRKRRTDDTEQPGGSSAKKPMEGEDRKRRTDDTEQPGVSPAKKPMDPQVAEQRAKELSELLARSQQLTAEVNDIVSEGPGNWYMDLVIKQIHEYNRLKDMAQSVIGVVGNLDIMPLREVYEYLGFYYDENE